MFDGPKDCKVHITALEIKLGKFACCVLGGRHLNASTFKWLDSSYTWQLVSP